MPNTSITKASPGQQGFTLIEIIAVLVILGILAAVAVPRFVDLQDEARNKAIDGAFAAGASQLSMNYAQSLLSTDGDDVTSWDADSSVLTLGDFSVELSGGCGDDAAKVTITNGPAWIDSVDSTTKGFTICDTE